MGRLILKGCKGADVRALQDVLNFHIRRWTPLTVDGDFGSRTHDRVVEFQKANRLKVDGVVGPQTLGKLFEEELLPLSLLMIPVSADKPSGIQPPRLVPPLTLPPISPPQYRGFMLPPASLANVPALNQRGQLLSLTLTSPVRNDPLDPQTTIYNRLIHLASSLPPSFPFLAVLIDQIPKPVKKIGQLNLDPVSPMSFGFKWGVEPLFDLKSVGPPVEFSVGVNPNARYVLKLIDRPGVTVPQLGLFGQGDFKGSIDWTSEKAQSRPLVEINGSVVVGIEGRF